MNESLKILASMRSRHDEEARQARLAAMKLLGADLTTFSSSPISASSVASNIEGFIGCTAVPTGVVGPLLFKSGAGPLEKTEAVFALAATSEGALVASMNRGAHVLSQSGGFRSHVIHQKMMRAPAFRFSNLDEAVIFERWLKARVPLLKEHVKKFSKHAELLEVRTLVVGSVVECKLSYSSGDAAGQNMTTTCSWHLCLKIEEDFNQEHEFKILKFILDGSGSSDKRVSYYQIGSGRGVHVACEAVIPAAVLKKTLKVTSKEFLEWGLLGKHLSSFDGSVGHSVNIANTIAAIFLATGQDMACVHESSTGFMHAEDRDGDLYVCLNLPRLVIGTVGGGTGLPGFQQALKLMGCSGPGKIERFACLIAGFALGLELSTLSAMVSGEFAMAHERMGKNRPVEGITREQWLSQQKGLSFEVSLPDLMGAVGSLVSNTDTKRIGFDVFKNETSGQRLLFKSRLGDSETLNALYKVTGAVSPKFLKEFCKIQNETEYSGAPLREARILAALSSHRYSHMPQFFGHHYEQSAEQSCIVTEYLAGGEVAQVGSTPDLLTKDRLMDLFRAIAQAQKVLTAQELRAPGELHVSRTSHLYLNAARAMLDPEARWDADETRLGLIRRAVSRTETRLSGVKSGVDPVVVHNDLRPTHVFISKTRGPLLVGWELSSVDLPMRDPLEFMLRSKLPQESLLDLLWTYQKVFEEVIEKHHTDAEWLAACKETLDSFILSKYAMTLALAAHLQNDPSEQITQNLVRLEELLQTS
jgi:hydroxymethylglutaryl-CoA reductase (NADPH)